MSTRAPNLVSSGRRAVPLCARRDLQTQRIDFQGSPSWVVKDPLSLAYYRLLPEQYCLLQLLDGRRSLESIQQQVQREFPASEMRLSDIQSLIADLYERGLIHSNRPGRAAVLLERDGRRRRRALAGAITNLFFIRIPGWDPATLLDRMYPLVRWMFSPPALLGGALLTVASWWLLLVRFADFQRDLPAFSQFFGWPNLLLLWVTLGAAKLVHELAHACACRHFGGECHEIGVAFLVFSPCLYCDVTDSWMLPGKYQRIAIGAAGMCIEVVLSAAALLLWWSTHPGLFHYLCLNVFFVTTFTTVIFNANPLLRYDGYYMLADWLEIPNLRPKADELLKNALAWHCFGTRIPADPFAPGFGRVWFAAFSACAAAYRWALALMTAWFLYWLLKPYGLENLGWGMAAVTVGAMGARGASSFYCMVARSERISMIKAACTLVALGAGLWASLAVPLPLWSTAAFTVEPYGVRHVHTAIPGTLIEICVQPGQKVREGAVLARLADFEHERRFRELLSSRERKQIELRIQHALDEPSQENYHAEMLRNIEKELNDLKRQIARLTVVAPCDGVVVAPAPVPEPGVDRLAARLPTWHGSPLEPRNIGCHLEARTHLLSIAPDSRTQAVLVFDERAQAGLAPGKRVSLKLDSLPQQTFRGKVVQLADKNVETAPAALSTRYGGSVATITDAEGRERVQEVAFQAGVLLDAAEPPALTGMRGAARFTAQSRTLGEWLWQQVRRTVHFRM